MSHQSQRETYFHKFCENWLANQRFVRVPGAVLGSAPGPGVCWLLVSHWIHVLAGSHSLACLWLRLLLL